MVEDRTLEGLEVRARVEPELLAEGLAGGVVGAQRVRLPTRPVQGQDQLLTEAFAQRHLADEVRQDPRRFAVATQPEQQIHPTLDRDPAELFEPGDLAPDELVIRDVLQAVPRHSPSAASASSRAACSASVDFHRGGR